MSQTDQDIRNRLIARIRRLSTAKLGAVEEFVARLEQGEGTVQGEPEIHSGVKPPHSRESGVKPPHSRESGVKPPHSRESGVEPPHSRESGVEPPHSRESGVEPPHSRESGVKPPHSKDWPHAPVHRISEHGTYIVTAGTLYKQQHFRGKERLDLVESKLLELARNFGWHIEAWAVFANHYHFVAHSRPESAKLNTFLGTLHTATATVVNQLDGTPSRQVWHNFWETKLTYERSYLARLNYVHQNAVKHGLVRVANQYRWCSAAWFERTATPAQVKTIYLFKIDKLKVLDDFDVVE